MFDPNHLSIFSFRSALLKTQIISEPYGTPAVTGVCPLPDIYRRTEANVGVVNEEATNETLMTSSSSS